MQNNEAFATIRRILDLAAADGRLEDAVAELERYAQKRVKNLEDCLRQLKTAVQTGGSYQPAIHRANELLNNQVTFK